MTIKEWFAKWLKDADNKAYLSHLSTCNQNNNKPQISDTNNTNHHAQKKQVPKPRKIQIKPFYLKKRSTLCINEELKHITIEYRKILSHFQTDGLNIRQFEMATIHICGLTKYCSTLLFKKILSVSGISSALSLRMITLSMFVEFWKSYFVQDKGIAFRMIQLLKQNQANDFLIRQDFILLVREILFLHPGLEFLRASTEFHDFYIATVIARIFYYIDTNKDNKISVRELRKSNFLDILRMLDEVLDINEIFDYFSYEHFYVIYSKFWELDEDGDNYLTKHDLIKYGDFALTPKVIDRVINGSANMLRDKEAKRNMMRYEQFVEFIISEEDKTNVIALKYWFHILDLDGDGILSPYELKIFFEQQAAKILNICGETVSFENVLRLLNDMIHPKCNFKFTMRDIKKSRMGHMFFDTLININKFALSEQKDIELINEIRNSPHMTDWDRFASKEYFALANS